MSYYNQLVDLLKIKNNTKERDDIYLYLNMMIEESKRNINHYTSTDGNKLLSLIFEKNKWLIPWINDNQILFNSSNILAYHAMYSTKEIFEHFLNAYNVNKDNRDFYIYFKYASSRRYGNLQKLYKSNQDTMEDILLQSAIIGRNKEIILFLLKNNTFLKNTPFKVDFDLCKENSEILKFFNTIYPNINLNFNLIMPKTIINSKDLKKIVQHVPYLDKIPSTFTTKINIYQMILSDISYFKENLNVIKDLDINKISWEFLKPILFKSFSEFFKLNLPVMTPEEISFIPQNIILTSTGFSKNNSSFNKSTDTLTDSYILNFLSDKDINNDKKENFSKLKWKISGNSFVKFLKENGNNIPLKFLKGHISSEEMGYDKTLNIKQLIESLCLSFDSKNHDALLFLFDEYGSVEPEIPIDSYDLFDKHLYFYGLNRNKDYTNLLLDKGFFEADRIHEWLITCVKQYFLNKYTPKKPISFYLENGLEASNNSLKGFEFVKHDEKYIDERVEEVKNYLILKENEILKNNIANSDIGIKNKKRI